METFKTKLIAEGPGGAWTFLRLPFDSQKAFGSKARVSVRGTINGLEFRSSILPNGKGGHHMMVNKVMLAGAEAKAGETVLLTMEVDDAPRTVTVPADLKKAINANAAAKNCFGTLSPSCKKEYVDWITNAKREETRKGRVIKAVALLAQGRRRLTD